MTKNDGIRALSIIQVISIYLSRTYSTFCSSHDISGDREKLPCIPGLWNCRARFLCPRSKCFHGTPFNTSSIRYMKVGKMGTAAALPSSNCDNFINFRTHSKAPSIFCGLLDSNSNHELLASATPSLHFFKTFFCFNYYKFPF